jgi:predicted amidophosphoribosyltransferase
MLQAAGSFLARLLWPDRCPACYAGPPAGGVFCTRCDVTVMALDRACPGCALHGGGLAERCHVCRTRPFPFSQARASLIYGGAVADALVRFKHGSSLASARPLARFLIPLLEWADSERADAIVPVPLHPRRLRQRGFNQALELVREGLSARAARAAAFNLRSLELPIWPDVLRRHLDTPALGREAGPVRRCRLAGAFSVAAPGRIRNQRIVVVDDVMTSGATFAECARTLLDAGAREVLVAALSRTLPG